MMRTIDKGAVWSGVVFLLIGGAFTLEALDVWAFRLGDLQFLGPIALIIAGLVVAMGALARNRTS